MTYIAQGHGERCALMIRPILTKIGSDQAHPDDNQPWSDFISFLCSFLLKIVLVFTSVLKFLIFYNFF